LHDKLIPILLNPQFHPRKTKMELSLLIGDNALPAMRGEGDQWRRAEGCIINSDGEVFPYVVEEFDSVVEDFADTTSWIVYRLRSTNCFEEDGADSLSWVEVDRSDNTNGGGDNGNSNVSARMEQQAVKFLTHWVSAKKQNQQLGREQKITDALEETAGRAEFDLDWQKRAAQDLEEEVFALEQLQTEEDILEEFSRIDFEQTTEAEGMDVERELEKLGDMEIDRDEIDEMEQERVRLEREQKKIAKKREKALVTE
jgi:hypothetical protein